MASIRIDGIAGNLTLLSGGLFLARIYIAFLGLLQFLRFIFFAFFRSSKPTNEYSVNASVWRYTIYKNSVIAPVSPSILLHYSRQKYIVEDSLPFLDCQDANVGSRHL